MEERQQKKEELKHKIYEVYSKCYDPSLDRQKCTGQLWDLASRWCKEFILINDKEIFYEEKIKTKNDKVRISFNEMGEEIFLTIQNFINEEKMSKEEFLHSFRAALVNSINLYHRNKAEGALREPRIKKVIKKIIEDEEANKGRKLTQEEKINHIHELTSLRKETILEHLIIMDRKFINFIHDYDDKDEKKVESMAGRSLTAQGPVSDPKTEAIEDSIADIFMNELEDFLNKAQDRTKDCDRAICTLYCVKKIKNYRKIKPILDAEILEMCESGKKLPTQAEIFLKYHPDDEKKSAESLASERIAKFKMNLEKAIKEKYPYLLYKTLSL